VKKGIVVKRSQQDAMTAKPSTNVGYRSERITKFDIPPIDVVATSSISDANVRQIVSVNDRDPWNDTKRIVNLNVRKGDNVKRSRFDSNKDSEKVSESHHQNKVSRFSSAAGDVPINKNNLIVNADASQRNSRPLLHEERSRIISGFPEEARAMDINKPKIRRFSDVSTDSLQAPTIPSLVPSSHIRGPELIHSSYIQSTPSENFNHNFPPRHNNSQFSRARESSRSVQEELLHSFNQQISPYLSVATQHISDYPHHVDTMIAPALDPESFFHSQHVFNQPPAYVSHDMFNGPSNNNLELHSDSMMNPMQFDNAAGYNDRGHPFHVPLHGRMDTPNYEEENFMQMSQMEMRMGNCDESYNPWMAPPLDIHYPSNPTYPPSPQFHEFTQHPSDVGYATNSYAFPQYSQVEPPNDDIRHPQSQQRKGKFGVNDNRDWDTAGSRRYERSNNNRGGRNGR
jgi:hypothetical protein